MESATQNDKPLSAERASNQNIVEGTIKLTVQPVELTKQDTKYFLPTNHHNLFEISSEEPLEVSSLTQSSCSGLLQGWSAAATVYPKCPVILAEMPSGSCTVGVLCQRSSFNLIHPEFILPYSVRPEH